MLAELGQILLITAFIVALCQALIPLWGAQKQHNAMMRFGDRAALFQSAVLIFCYGLLTWAFLTSDFSVRLAAEHSHIDKPLLYKITGVWANHEGSILLWVLILSIYGAMVPIFGKKLPLSLRARAIGVQGLLSSGFIGFTLFTSNPFARLAPIPIEGLGLNPLLQDPGLAFHPPFLYLGYVGFSLSFAFACAALLEGQVDSLWARWLRPWVLLAWSFLTIGITLGSYWAYYELGWGGWWMWDPVENVSFMPWLAGTALLHSILVLGTRGSLPSWTVMLAITTFGLSLLGTFGVRSGILMSVHTFAEDPTRGLYLLGLLAIFISAALVLFAFRASSLAQHDRFEPMSRSGALVFNNLMLIIATLVVFAGTFYPVLMEAVTDYKLGAFGPAIFNNGFIPIMSLLILAMGFGPLLKWERDRPDRIKNFLKILLIPTLVIILFIAIFGKSAWKVLGFGLAAYLMVSLVLSLLEKRGRLRHQSSGYWGFISAHFGVALFTLAVTVLSTGTVENSERLLPGQSINVANYTFTLTKVTGGRGPNYEYNRAQFNVTKDGEATEPLYSEFRFFPVRKVTTSEAALRFGPKDTILAAISDPTEQGWAVRAYKHPGVVWIWIGALFIALGGFISLTDRRLRMAERRDFEVDQRTSS